MSEKSFDTNLQKSKDTLIKIKENPQKFRMLTGDRPTGKLHIGHLFGSIKNRVEMQNIGVNTMILIADYQVITDRDNTKHIKDFVYNMIADYLACGIDSSKTPIFCHSAIAPLNQLMLPFLSLVSQAELLRNPTVKAEQEASGHELTGLLLTYPVHQACDILFCKANVVPVGKDQLPHIELTRQIARRFNKRYKKVFCEPVGILSNIIEVPGLDGRKMSKSYGNAISLAMSADETAKLIKKSQTDCDRNIYFDPENRPGVSALLTTGSLCSGMSVEDIASKIGDSGSGALKAFVTDAVNSYLEPIREKRIKFLDDIPMLEKVLEQGNEEAFSIAEKTLTEVKEAMGMIY